MWGAFRQSLNGRGSPPLFQARPYQRPQKRRGRLCSPRQRSFAPPVESSRSARPYALVCFRSGAALRHKRRDVHERRVQPPCSDASLDLPGAAPASLGIRSGNRELGSTFRRIRHACSSDPFGLARATRFYVEADAMDHRRTHAAQLDSRTASRLSPRSPIMSLNSVQVHILIGVITTLRRMNHGVQGGLYCATTGDPAGTRLRDFNIDLSSPLSSPQDLRRRRDPRSAGRPTGSGALPAVQWKDRQG
jgi:hypothetical protein